MNLTNTAGMSHLKLNVSTFIAHFGISKCTINVDTLDLFSRRPDDDSIELKHVALNVIV